MALGKWKTPLILAGIAVAAYLAYRWWQSRQSASPTGGLGTNLNSVAPELVGGSSGPDSGITYSPPSPTISITEPVDTEGANPVNHPKPPPPPHRGKLHGKPIQGRPPVRRPPARPASPNPPLRRMT